MHRYATKAKVNIPFLCAKNARNTPSKYRILKKVLIFFRQNNIYFGCNFQTFEFTWLDVLADFIVNFWRENTNIFVFHRCHFITLYSSLSSVYYQMQNGAFSFNEVTLIFSCKT